MSNGKSEKGAIEASLKEMHMDKEERMTCILMTRYVEVENDSEDEMPALGDNEMSWVKSISVNHAQDWTNEQNVTYHKC